MQDLSTISIETNRINLASISLQYKQDVFENFNEALTVFMFPAPFTNILEAEMFIKRREKEHKERTGITMVILSKKDDAFLGIVSLEKLNEEIPEFGVWIKKSAHGNGYGKEAVHVLKDWANKHYKHEKYSYPCAAENIASRKIPESLEGTIIAEWDMDFQGIKRPAIEYHIPR